MRVKAGQAASRVTRQSEAGAGVDVHNEMCTPETTIARDQEESELSRCAVMTISGVLRSWGPRCSRGRESDDVRDGVV